MFLQGALRKASRSTGAECERTAPARLLGYLKAKRHADWIS